VDIIVKEQTENKASLNIQVLQADIHGDFQKKIKDFAKRANLKGFRPGKVPPAIIEKMYGKDLKSEVITEFVNKTLSEYIKEQNLNILGDVLLMKHPGDDDRNWPTKETLDFQFDMALIPDFDLPDLSQIEFVLPEIQVDEEKVNDYINSLRDQFGESVEADISSDKSILDVKIEHGDWSANTKITKKEFKADTVKLFEGQAIGYSEDVDFKVALEERIFDKFLPKDDMQHLNNGPVKVTINSISDRKPAELDQKFYSMAARNVDLGSYEEFVEHVRALFRNTYDEESASIFSLQVKRKIPKHFNITLAEDIILEQIKSKNKADEDMARIEQDLPKIIDEIKYNLLTNKLLKESNFVITDEILESGAKKMILKEFADMGMTGFNLDDEFLSRYAKSYLTADNNKNLRKVEEAIINDKIADIIKEKGNFVRKSVTIEELNQMVDDLFAL
jgi:trigger factor